MQQDDDNRPTAGDTVSEIADGVKNGSAGQVAGAVKDDAAETWDDVKETAGGAADKARDFMDGDDTNNDSQA